MLGTPGLNDMYKPQDHFNTVLYILLLLNENPIHNDTAVFANTNIRTWGYPTVPEVSDVHYQ